MGNVVEKYCKVKIVNDLIFIFFVSCNYVNFLEEIKIGIFVYRILVVIICEFVFNCFLCFGIYCKEVVYLFIYK